MNIRARVLAPMLAAALASCGAPGATPNPSPSPLSVPTAAPTPVRTPMHTARPTPSPMPTDAPTAAPSPTPRPTPRSEWPFVATYCPDAPGAPWLVAALGTSETAGWGIRADERFSPQVAYPAQYAEILCSQFDAPVELHSYFPSQLGNEMAPLAWWIDKVSTDAGLRADLASADVAVLWALSSHDVLMAHVRMFGGCTGEWPDPRRTCLEQKTAHIPAETDEVFGLIAGMVRDDTTVLAGDAYAPPALVGAPDWDQPFADEIARMIDPYYVVEQAAARHGFVFVDTEIVFNGESRREMPAAGLFQADGLHPTAAGALLTAETYDVADGLGD